MALPILLIISRTAILSALSGMEATRRLLIVPLKRNRFVPGRPPTYSMLYCQMSKIHFKIKDTEDSIERYNHFGTYFWSEVGGGVEWSTECNSFAINVEESTVGSTVYDGGH